MADCPQCFSEVEPLGVESGGRIAWFCWECETIYPDGDYIDMRQHPLGIPHD